jgi:hypothetical protein
MVLVMSPGHLCGLKVVCMAHNWVFRTLFVGPMTVIGGTNLQGGGCRGQAALRNPPRHAEGDTGGSQQSVCQTCMCDFPTICPGACPQGLL